MTPPPAVRRRATVSSPSRLRVGVSIDSQSESEPEPRQESRQNHDVRLTGHASANHYNWHNDLDGLGQCDDTIDPSCGRGRSAVRTSSSARDTSMIRRRRRRPGRSQMQTSKQSIKCTRIHGFLAPRPLATFAGGEASGGDSPLLPAEPPALQVASSAARAGDGSGWGRSRTSSSRSPSPPGRAGRAGARRGANFRPAPRAPRRPRTPGPAHGGGWCPG